MAYIDMTGWKMSEHEVPDSRWEVLEKADVKVNGQICWLCRCSCEKHVEKIIPGGELRRGKTKSCGCFRSEFSSKKQSILKDNKLNVKPEYSFKDFKNPKTNIALRFDFGICDNNENLQYLIEYDGEQYFYYQENVTSWNTKENFENTKYRDSIKNQYCLNNGIPLYRIPYYDIDKINTLQDILQDKYLVKPK